jgi:ribosome biogenesis GTPase / thiamine phosphate phosphatase
MSLERFGWNSHFENEFARVSAPGKTAARVACLDRGLFVVWSETEELEATVTGQMRHGSQDWPAVGDWVVLEEGSRISAVLSRKTALSRKQPGTVTEQQVIAANIDVVFIVSGLDGDFNPRRIERYLLLAQDSRAKPVVVLNKADVCAQASEALAATEALASGAPVIMISAKEGWGVSSLEEHLAAGQTAALVGSSGAGKSTLLNRLLGEERQRVQEVRAGDSRGRHTTVRRELFLTNRGWLLIDTPGLRELQLWANPATIGAAFDDILALAKNCRFRNCGHQGEPGCAVAGAGIDEARLASYSKLQRELAHLERQQDRRAALEEKRRIKRIHREMRGLNRE